MTKTITLTMFVLAFALCAKAEEAVAIPDGTTGTSFENQKPGVFHPEYNDQGEAVGSGEGTFWRSEANTNSAVVTTYKDVPPAYEYTAANKRSPYLEKSEHTTNNFLSLNLEAPLERLILPHIWGGAVTNVFIEESDRIYADTLVKFSPSVAEPTVDGDLDKVIVWMKETESDDGRVATNLMVTAGRYAGDYGKVEVGHYAVTNKVAADTWCRLTIRTIPDVTEYKGGAGHGIARQAPAFVIYLDGKPVAIEPAATDGYRVIGADTVDRSILSAEARMLISERRLFPWLADAASSKAMVLSRFAFGGLGAVDDVTFSTNRPEYVTADRVFTLQWDAGIVGEDMLCIISNATGVATNHINTTAESNRSRDYSLGTNLHAVVTVTNFAYDVKNGYSNGVWSAVGCVLNGNSFVYEDQGDNPIGYATSSRNVIGVGAGGCETFAEAKKRARQQGSRTLQLMTNVVIKNSHVPGDIYYDKGSFEIGEGEDFVLDLNGYTLRGTGENPTVSQSGGSLRITDSSKTNATGMTGRVLPNANGRSRVAVKSCPAMSATSTELVIDAGWYDGTVVITNRGIGKISTGPLPTCVVEGGGFTNAYNDVRRFYLEQYVTNTSLYFGLSSANYWLVAADGFIWCGAGADNRWDNKDNWKCKAVPGAGDLAIFPPTAVGAWPVDFGTGVATTELWMDADIDMSGTNEFSDVTVVSGAGRFVGSGMMTFTGKLPGMLRGDTGTGTEAREVRLGAGWSGCVRISNILKAQTLTSIMGWGTALSTVEFNGVCGYLSDRTNHAMPYGLVLTDLVTDGGAKTNSAWKNDTGYTGSVVSFPTLSGSGTFESPKNLREILQVFQFKEVRDFTGRFKLGGKRLLLGTGSAAKAAKAGYFMFANAVGVRGGLDWSGVSAHFGTNLVVYGKLSQSLMSYSDKTAPAVDAVVVTLINSATGETNETCRLKAEGGKITIVSGGTVTYGGKKMDAENAASSVKSGETFEIPDGSAVTIDGNRVIVNGMVVSTFADYYKVMPAGGSTYAVTFDEDEAAPTLAEVSLVEEEGKAVLLVTNAKVGQWYGVQTKQSIGDDWPELQPTDWKVADGDTMKFDADAIGASGFFRVIMTDKDPTGGSK